MSRAVSRTPLRAFTALLGLVAIAGFATFFYDHSRRDQIAKGVRVQGVPVGGLSAAAARTKLQRRVQAEMEKPVVVRYAGKSWTLTPRQAGLAVDVNGTVERALHASREGSILTRTWRNLTGGAIKRDIPLAVSYSRARVRGFVGQLRSTIDRAPLDASVQASAAGLSEIQGRDGLALNGALLARRVGDALAGVQASRVVSAPVRRIAPAVTTHELAAKYPAYIVVDRASFQLRFYTHLELANTYPIAVGMQGLETTPGLYHIQWKQVNPPWYVPRSAWAGALAGKVIPPGPQDPLKARFMAFNGGAGIHGIDPSEYGSIGHDASHGCVRMRIPDVIALYARTPVGTPVYVI
ncbi:MAG: L,D-transpeptidase family protein [Solirubrobacteraceae bacterium]